jgi:hypothetical protein
MNDDAQYVVWDGVEERPYVETDVHDCMVTHDSELISVQKVRRQMINEGKEPVIVFACESGETCMEQAGKENSVFTYFLIKHFSWSSTLRNLVNKMNNDVWKHNYRQKAEVLCRADLLDTPLGIVPHRHNCTPILMTFDMCRKTPNIQS